MSAAGRTPIHQVPPCETAAGHDQCDPDFRTRDAGMQQALERGGAMGLLIMIVSGFRPGNQTFSRTRCSFQINNFLEWGWAHISGRSAPDWLSDLATELPDVARFAWGADAPSVMGTAAFRTKVFEAFKGRATMPAGWDWLSAGWAQICGRGDVQDWYTRRWYASYAAAVVNWAKGARMRDMRYLALAVRMRNSAKAYMSDIREVWQKNGGNASKAFDELAAIYVADRPGGSTRPGRISEIKALIPAGTRIDTYPSPSQIEWPTTPSDFSANLAAGQAPIDKGRAGGNTGLYALLGTAVTAGGWIAYKKGWLDRWL